MNETIGNQQPSSTAKLGWLAGIIDGEGCLQLARQKYKDKFHFRPQLVIGNTNKAIIEQLVLIAGENNLPVYLLDRHYAAQNSVCTTMVLQIIGLKRVKKWLDIITPYLVGKKDQAKIILDFIDYKFATDGMFGERDYEFRQLLDEANHRYRSRTAQRLNAEQTS